MLSVKNSYILSSHLRSPKVTHLSNELLMILSNYLERSVFMAYHLKLSKSSTTILFLLKWICLLALDLGLADVFLRMDVVAVFSECSMVPPFNCWSLFSIVLSLDSWSISCLLCSSSISIRASSWSRWWFNALASANASSLRWIYAILLFNSSSIEFIIIFDRFEFACCLAAFSFSIFNRSYSICKALKKEKFQN